jgi:peptide/nickel transport system permease protein
VVHALRSQFGLDQNLAVQYLLWMRNALTGNLGVSFTHQQPVLLVLAGFFPNTVLLASAVLAVEFALGLLFGGLAARYRNTRLDTFITNSALVAGTLPAFWVGLILLALFAEFTGLLPSAQMHSLGADGLPFFDRQVDTLKHLALPACTVALPGAAAVCRYFREGLVQTGGEEYVTYARSAGVSGARLYMYYRIPAAVSSVISLLGLEIGLLLGGVVVTETIFSWPGMGRLTVLAMFSRDYPLIMGCTLVAGAVVIFGNLVADILYAFIDPRVALS